MADLTHLFTLIESGDPSAAEQLLDPPPQPLPGPARSLDGFHHAVPEGNHVVVSDTSPLPANAWPLPNAVQRVRYHSEKAALANQTNQSFAAAFHLQRVALAETELDRIIRFQANSCLSRRSFQHQQQELKQNSVSVVEGNNEE